MQFSCFNIKVIIINIFFLDCRGIIFPRCAQVWNLAELQVLHRFCSPHPSYTDFNHCHVNAMCVHIAFAAMKLLSEKRWDEDRFSLLAQFLLLPILSHTLAVKHTKKDLSLTLCHLSRSIYHLYFIFINYNFLTSVVEKPHNISTAVVTLLIKTLHKMY